MNKAIQGKKRLSFLSWAPCSAGLAVVVAILTMGAESCETLKPGEIGTPVCLSCHDGHNAPGIPNFQKSFHAAVGCEACHGPGYLHAWSNGNTAYIQTFEDASLDVLAPVCSKCHAADVEGYKQSVHAQQGLFACTQCHDVHGSQKTVRPFADNSLCLQCHALTGFANKAQIEAHTFHPDDPEVTGASRCTACHMAPLQRTDQAAGAHEHSFTPIRPIVSIEAIQRGTKPTPPNSCAGVMGCHDGTVASTPVFDVDSLPVEQFLQDLVVSRYGQ